MVRVDDPLVPRAIFGVLNYSFFSFGRGVSVAAFPGAEMDFGDRSVHLRGAWLRDLTLKNTGIEGIYVDVLVLLGIAAIMTTSSILLFKRQL